MTHDRLSAGAAKSLQNPLLSCSIGFPELYGAHLKVNFGDDGNPRRPRPSQEASRGDTSDWVAGMRAKGG
jgi:hypothetical protein